MLYTKFAISIFIIAGCPQNQEVQFLLPSIHPRRTIGYSRISVCDVHAETSLHGGTYSSVLQHLHTVCCSNNVFLSPYLVQYLSHIERFYCTASRQAKQLNAPLPLPPPMVGFAVSPSFCLYSPPPPPVFFHSVVKVINCTRPILATSANTSRDISR